MRNRLLQATTYAGLASLVRVASQVAKAKLSAVLLGPLGMGLVGQINYVWSVLDILSSLGLGVGLTKHTSEFDSPERDEERQQLHATIVVTGATVSLAVALLAFFFREQLAHFAFGEVIYEDLLSLSLLSIPVAVLGRYHLAVLRGYRDIRGVTYVSVLGGILGLVAFVPLIVMFRVKGVILSLLVYQGFILGLGLRVLQLTQRVKPLYQWRAFRWAMLRRNLPYGVAALLVSASSSVTIMVVSRRIIVELGLEANGVFAVTWKVSSVYIGLLIGAATMYYFPTVAGFKNDAHLNEAVRDEICETLETFLVLLAPLIALLIGLHELIVWTLFSRDFYHSGALFAFQLPGDVFRVTGELLSLPLLARGHLKTFGTLYLLFCAQFILLVYLFLDKGLGLTGVSLAYSTAHASNAGMALVAAVVTFRFRPTRSLAGVYVAAVALVAIASMASRTSHGPVVALLGASAWAVTLRKHSAIAFFRSSLLRRLGLGGQV